MKDRIKFINRIRFMTAAFAVTIAVLSGTVPSYASDSIYVIDNTKVLSEDTVSSINKDAEELCSQTKAQVQVVTVDGSKAGDLYQYSLDLFREEGLGDKSLNNGVLIALDTVNNHCRIIVGNGLEGALPDAKCGRILDKYTVPNYGKWDEAAKDTWNAVAAEVYTESGIDNSITQTYKEQTDDSDFADGLLGAAVIIIFFLGCIFIWTKISKRKYNDKGSGGSGNDDDSYIDFGGEDSFGGDSFGGGSSSGGGAGR